MESPLVLGAITVLIGLAAIAFTTFRNAAPTQSIAHVLHDVEHPAAPAPAPTIHRS